MRVVNSSMNRKFGVSVNDVHSKLNKSLRECRPESAGLL